MTYPNQRSLTEPRPLLAGVVNSDGRLWKDQRRFLHERLRHFGMTYLGTGKGQMEARIMREVESFVSTLEEHGEGPVDLNPILAVSISNVICSMIMSMRFSHNDARFRRFMDLIDEGFRLFGTLAPVNFIPALRHVPWLQETRKKLAQVSAGRGPWVPPLV